MSDQENRMSGKLPRRPENGEHRASGKLPMRMENSEGRASRSSRRRSIALTFQDPQGIFWY